jgi:hypothetical protein
MHTQEQVDIARFLMELGSTKKTKEMAQQFLIEAMQNGITPSAPVYYYGNPCPAGWTYTIGDNNCTGAK